MQKRSLKKPSYLIALTLALGVIISSSDVIGQDVNKKVLCSKTDLVFDQTIYHNIGPKDAKLFREYLKSYAHRGKSTKVNCD